MKEYGIRGDARYRLLESELLGEGCLVRLVKERVRLPNGHEMEQDRIELPPAVAVVPLLEDPPGELFVVLVEQFRNAVRGYLHEIPAGILAAGEEPAACAVRELEEETGFRAGRVEHLASLLMVPGTSSHRLHFFLAEELTPGAQDLEPAECLRVRKVPFEPLVRRVVEEPPGSSVVVDAKTHLALLHVKALIDRRGR